MRFQSRITHTRKYKPTEDMPLVASSEDIDQWLESLSSREADIGEAPPVHPVPNNVVNLRPARFPEFR